MSDRILFLSSYADKPYLRNLKGCVGGATVPVCSTIAKTKMELIMFCQKHKITQVLSTQIPILMKLLDWQDTRKKPSLSDYAGSHFWLNDEIEIVFIPPLKQIVTVPYGKFFTTRLAQKFTNRKQWFQPTEFGWELLEPKTSEGYLISFSNADLIAVDIETVREDAAIKCISYTAFYFNDVSSIDRSLYSSSIVIPMDTVWGVHMMRKFNALPAAKILQKGRYDISYMTRYGAPLYNYRWDTANLFHAWLSELPKDLGFLNAFMLREAVYWKDLADTDDLMEYYRYNALDTWGTGNAFLAMMQEYPEYAMTNYRLEFPQQFPCHLAEMTGIKRSAEALARARKEEDDKVAANEASLNKMLGLKNFNTNSVPQVKQLLHILGCKDIKTTGEADLEKARFRHPLNARILQHIIDNRKARKSVSTYLTTGEKAKEFKGRILFALNPDGTDTSRLASKEHHFWCGYNIQNQTRGPSIKQTYIADPGFKFAEVDLSKAETWDTAYLSGDKGLIEAVNSVQDFHAINAHRFFGTPYEEIFDDETQKILDKILRDLAKRTNHGSTYNMGAYVLIDTIGLEKIFTAKRILELPRFYTAMQVADHLIEAFHKAYPRIRSVYHTGVIEEVNTTGYLKSKAMHWLPETEVNEATLTFANVNYEKLIALPEYGAWTRRCFGKPDKSRHQRNSLIAHGPQSLNAQTLNKAWLRVFKDVAIHPEHAPNFKLCAQVHDSIFFQFRIGHEYLCEMVKERMEIPVTLKGYDDVIRTFTVPADIKAGPDGKGADYWSETE